MASYELADMMRMQMSEEMVCCGEPSFCPNRFNCQSFGIGVTQLPQDTLENKLRGLFGLPQKSSDEYGVVVYLKAGARPRKREYRSGVDIVYVSSSTDSWYRLRSLIGG